MSSDNTSFTPTIANNHVAQRVDEAVGNVPFVRLNRIHPLCQQHHIYIKLDSCNPSGSIKDKNAAYLVNKAEQEGLLKPGGTIIESSSGNFGLALASIGAARGYRIIIVIDAKTPPPVIKMLKAYGAQLEEVPLSMADQAGSMQKARMHHAQQLAATLSNAFYPCQHLNADNPAAHYHYTAREIAAAFSSPPNVIVVGISTAGQLAGIARYFRTHSPKTHIIAVDIAGSGILGEPRHAYKMTGLGLSFVPPSFNKNHLDYGFTIDDHTAFSMCHYLAQREGLLLGASTGAIVSAGLSYLQQQDESLTMVMINPDRGDRYLDTVYNPSWLAEHKLSPLAQDALCERIKTLSPVIKRV